MGESSMITGCLVLAATLGVVAPANVDLAKIGRIFSKGRVQDKDYNNLPVVDGLISMGPSAIPFLVSKLDDERRVEGKVFDFWDDVRVGDVAFAVLCDFFLAADWKTPTVPGLEWDKLLDRRSPDVPSSTLIARFIAKHGRMEIRRRVETLLRAHAEGFSWDEKERCFRPAK
jgi:hypothetical protein